MDAASVEDAGAMSAAKTRWLILTYHLPREPSRPRVAVWRMLKSLGTLCSKLFSSAANRTLRYAGSLMCLGISFSVTLPPSRLTRVGE